MLSHQGRSVLTHSDTTLAEANIKAGSAIHVSVPLIGGASVEESKNETLPKTTLRIEAVAKSNADLILYREDFEGVNFKAAILRDYLAKFLRNMPDEHK